MNRAPIRAALLAFLISRAIFFALLIAGSQLSFLGKVYSNSIWETQIRLDAGRVRPNVESMVMVGDAWWYYSIAVRGYGPQPDRGPNWAFFPLFPLLTRYAHLTDDFALDGMLVANVSCLGALVLFALLAPRAGFRPEDAERAVYYLAFFPTSYFLSMPLTEGLFLLLSVAAFLGAFSNRWWLAGIAGALASATRITGALLIVPLALHAIVQRDRRVSTYAWLACVPAGVVAFFSYLGHRTGDFLAYVHTEASWGRAGSWPWRPLVDFFRDPSLLSDRWNLIALGAVVAILLLLAGIVLLAKRQFALGAYALLSLALPLSTGTLMSLSRYATVAFPLFLWLAILGRRTWFDRAWLATSTALIGWLVALFTLRVDFALV